MFGSRYRDKFVANTRRRDIIRIRTLRSLQAGSAKNMPSKEKYVIGLLLIICLRENFHENSPNIGVYLKNFVRSSKAFRRREIFRGSHLNMSAAANIFVIIIQVFLKMKSTPNTFANICQNFISC